MTRAAALHQLTQDRRAAEAASDAHAHAHAHADADADAAAADRLHAEAATYGPDRSLRFIRFCKTWTQHQAVEDVARAFAQRAITSDMQPEAAAQARQAIHVALLCQLADSAGNPSKGLAATARGLLHAQQTPAGTQGHPPVSAAQFAQLLNAVAELPRAAVPGVILRLAPLLCGIDRRFILEGFAKAALDMPVAAQTIFLIAVFPKEACPDVWKEVLQAVKHGWSSRSESGEPRAAHAAPAAPASPAQTPLAPVATDAPTASDVASHRLTRDIDDVMFRCSALSKEHRGLVMGLLRELTHGQRLRSHAHDAVVVQRLRSSTAHPGLPTSLRCELAYHYGCGLNPSDRKALLDSCPLPPPSFNKLSQDKFNAFEASMAVRGGLLQAGGADPWVLAPAMHLLDRSAVLTTRLALGCEQLPAIPVAQALVMTVVEHDVDDERAALLCSILLCSSALHVLAYIEGLTQRCLAHDEAVIPVATTDAVARCLRQLERRKAMAAGTRQYVAGELRERADSLDPPCEALYSARMPPASGDVAETPPRGRLAALMRDCAQRLARSAPSTG